jgi:carbon storage regulator CsrA
VNKEVRVLIITRGAAEQIVINDHIVVTVTRVKGNRVTIQIEAADKDRILRGEMVGSLPGGADGQPE